MRKIVFVLAVLMANAALAGDYDAGQVPFGEWMDTGVNTANRLICSTIGDPTGSGLFGCAKDDGSIGFANVLRTLNLLILALAGVFFSWNMMAVSVSAAAEGEFLGKRAHNAWVPLRMAVGASMITPVFGGFVLAQIVMLMLAAVGSGAASIAIRGTPPQFVQAGATIPAGLPKLSDYQAEIGAGYRCVAERAAWQAKKRADYAAKRAMDAANPLYLDQGENYAPLELSAKYGARVERTGDNILAKFGASGYNDDGDYAPDVCGSVLIKFAPLPADAGEDIKTTILASRTAFADMLNALVLKVGEAADAIGQRQQQAEADPSLRQAVEADAKLQLRQLDLYIANFDAAVMGKIAAAVQKIQAIVGNDKIEHGDWAALGYGNINHLRRSVYLMQGVTPANETHAAKPNSDDVQRGLLDRLTESAVDGAKSAAAYVSGAASCVASPVQCFNDKLDQKVNDLGADIAGRIKASSGDPISALQDLGIAIFTGIWTTIKYVVGAYVVAGVAAALLPNGTIHLVNFVAMLFVSLFSVIALPLIGVAFKGFVTLPFTFAINWTIALLNWLLVIVEGLIAAPLWGMMHLTPEGEGMGDATRKGYVFLVNLVAVPLIMCGTYYIAQACLFAAWGLFKGFVAGQIAGLHSTHGNWWINLIMIGGSVYVLIQFAEAIVDTCAKLLHAVPRRILAWVGGDFGSDVAPIHTDNQSLGRGVSSGIQQAAQGVRNNVQAAQRSARERGRDAKAKDAKDALGNNEAGERQEVVQSTQGTVQEQKISPFKLE